MSTPIRQFTGRHATAIISAFFAVVIAVNFTMAGLASSTFGGVVVENSYVASQKYNKWLGEAQQEATLGWSAKASRQADGRVSLVLAGIGNSEPLVAAVARHPLGHMPGKALKFETVAVGHYVSSEPIAPGRWRLRVEAVSGTQRWRQELDVQ